MRNIKLLMVVLVSFVFTFSIGVAAQERWTTTWAASALGPYPGGSGSSIQPDQSLTFPGEKKSANDQSFRMIVMPDVWGKTMRIRLTNAHGTQPVTFDAVYVGLQYSGSAVIPKTNTPVTFGAKKTVVIAPGAALWSDAISPAFAREPSSLTGRKLAVSFHVVGDSGPMTFHADALQTSYIAMPNSGARSGEEGESAFLNPVISWFFLDAVDMRLKNTRTIVAFGDSITDGRSSTLNGDDRWPNVLARRLHAVVYGDKFAVVNAGISGNTVVGPTESTPENPTRGGISAVSRIERDVISLSNVSAVFWLEGINDFSKRYMAPADAVIDGFKQGVALLRAKIPGVQVYGATVLSCLGTNLAAYGFPEQEDNRQALNKFIRSTNIFDAVVDFDKVTQDPNGPGLLSAFVPDSSKGGPEGDRLHPNRLGYNAMGNAVDISLFIPLLPK
ncbi:SGNH hydrolase [Betaproteobacteria bacterium]|nr:SGNH hydrolase [Betaproteobacteria bacterium]